MSQSPRIQVCQGMSISNFFTDTHLDPPTGVSWWQPETTCTGSQNSLFKGSFTCLKGPAMSGLCTRRTPHRWPPASLARRSHRSVGDRHPPEAKFGADGAL